MSLEQQALYHGIEEIVPEDGLARLLELNQPLVVK